MGLISDVSAALTALTAALKAQLSTQYLSANADLEFGKRYFIKGNVTLNLPASTARTTESTIYLTKSPGSTVVINVIAADATVNIVAGAETDKALTYDVDRPIALHYRPSSKTWYV